MDKAGLLRSIPLFASVPDREFEVLARSLGKRTFGKGMIIFHGGSLGPTRAVAPAGNPSAHHGPGGQSDAAT